MQQALCTMRQNHQVWWSVVWTAVVDLRLLQFIDETNHLEPYYDKKWKQIFFNTQLFGMDPFKPNHHHNFIVTGCFPSDSYDVLHMASGTWL